MFIMQAGLSVRLHSCCVSVCACYVRASSQSVAPQTKEKPSPHGAGRGQVWLQLEHLVSRQRDVKGSGGDKELRLGFNLEETLGGGSYVGSRDPTAAAETGQEAEGPSEGCFQVNRVIPSRDLGLWGTLFPEHSQTSSPT